VRQLPASGGIKRAANRLRGFSGLKSLQPSFGGVEGLALKHARNQFEDTSGSSGPHRKSHQGGSLERLSFVAQMSTGSQFEPYWFLSQLSRLQFLHLALIVVPLHCYSINTSGGNPYGAMDGKLCLFFSFLGNAVCWRKLVCYFLLVVILGIQ
jgi:hypothetical protein